jgi:hypothetical protein
MQIFRERPITPGFEAECSPIFTDIRMPGPTSVTNPITKVEWNGHMVAVIDRLDVSTHLHGVAGRFVSQ